MQNKAAIILLLLSFSLLLGCQKQKPAQITEAKQDIPRGVAVETEPVIVQESETVNEDMPEDIASYIGQYIYDSHTIIEQQNTRINTQEIENAVIQIGYNQKEKCLTLSNGNFKDSGNIDITKIREDEPFFQYYGESAGHTKTDYYFQNDGITLVYERVLFDIEEETESSEKFVAYYKKAPQEDPAKMFAELYEQYSKTERKVVTISERGEGAGMFIFDVGKTISENIFCRVEMFSSMGQTQYLVYNDVAKNIWYFHKKAYFYEKSFTLENAKIVNTYFLYTNGSSYAYNEKTKKYDIKADTDKYQAVTDVHSLAGLIEIVQDKVNGER